MKFGIAFYKGTPKGFKGIFNRLIRWKTKSIYSHCEMVFSDGLCASSSYMDKGVRFKYIDLSSENWDFVELPEQWEKQAREWFIRHEKEEYDLWGNLHFIFKEVKVRNNKWFCSEACAASLGIIPPENYSPEKLSAAVKNINKGVF